MAKSVKSLDEFTSQELGAELNRRDKENRRLEALRATVEAVRLCLANLPGGKIADYQLDDAAKLAYKLAYSTLPGGDGDSIFDEETKPPTSGMSYGWYTIGENANKVLDTLTEGEHGQRKYQ